MEIGDKENASMAIIRVLIVEDQEIVRSGLKAVIENERDLTVVGEAADGVEAISLSRELSPDVVLMDLNLPKIDGIEATVRLLQGESPPKVLILTVFDTRDHLIEALSAGASGFLLKGVSARKLNSSIRSVAAGGVVLSSKMMDSLAGQVSGLRVASTTSRMRGIDSLTVSERQVLGLLGRGLTNQQIAARLHFSVTTVKTYVSRLLAKLNLENRTQAAILAYEARIIEEVE